MMYSHVDALLVRTTQAARRFFGSRANAPWNVVKAADALGNLRLAQDEDQHDRNYARVQVKRTDFGFPGGMKCPAEKGGSCTCSGGCARAKWPSWSGPGHDLGMLKQTLWHLAQSAIARRARNHEWTRIHLESAGRWAAWELNQDPTRDVTAELTRAFQRRIVK
jgi:hypothetical protein